jgi:hypothetical protein
MGALQFHQAKPARAHIAQAVKVAHGKYLNTIGTAYFKDGLAFLALDGLFIYDEFHNTFLSLWQSRCMFR